MVVVNDVEVGKLRRLNKAIDYDAVEGIDTINHYVKEEAGETVFEYFKSIGIFENNNTVVLSSKHYYSYSNDFVRDSKVVFNLKNTNQINNINLFFYKLNRILPINGYYIGSFENLVSVRRLLKNNSTTNRFVYYNYLIYLILYRTIRYIPIVGEIVSLLNNGRMKYLTSTELIKMLDDYGFQVVVLKVFDQRTYFMAKKVHRQRKLRKVFLNIQYLLDNRKNLI